MHDAPSSSEIFVAADDVLATHFADEAVILDLRDGVYYGLDAVGARIWRLLERPISIHDLREAIVSEFDVPYPSLYDPAGETAVDLGYPYLPGTYVVDPDGTIRWVVIGETDAQELSGLIDDVLAA